MRAEWSGMRLRIFAAVLTVGSAMFISSCATRREAGVDLRPAQTVWSVDLIRTMPGAQAEFLRTIEMNWGTARTIARQQGAVRSYHALAATPDSARGWDVLLITEYADSASFNAREAIFREIFRSTAYMSRAIRGGRPADELRAFVGAEAVLRTVVDGRAKDK